MKDIGRVYIFQAAKGLVNEGLEVCVGEWLLRSDLRGNEGEKGALSSDRITNDSMQISLHKFFLHVGSGVINHLNYCERT